MEEKKSLAAAVERLADRILVVDDTLTDILHEIRWLIQNRSDVRVINRMPSDPADPEWSAKLAAMNPNPEVLACAGCDCDSPPSLSSALEQGWTRLQIDDGAGWNYLGMCAKCSKKDPDDEELTRGEIGEGTRDETEKLLYCCDNPKLEWNGDEDHPGVSCESCGFTVVEQGSVVMPPVEEEEKPKEPTETQRELF